MLRTILRGIVILALGTGCTSRDAAVAHPDFSGLYRPAGLEVQPCGRNEWMRRSFETDTFCNGDDSAFPFTDLGRERWKSYNVIDDPVLGCVEDFPRNAMRGRPMKITLGEEITEIAYWFNNEWSVRRVHMNGEPAPAATPNSVGGYSTGRWVGDTLVVETRNRRADTPLRGSSENMRLTERFTRIADDVLLSEFTVDDPDAFVQPWTVQITSALVTDNLMYEYGWQEGNEWMYGILGGARGAERAAEEARN